MAHGFSASSKSPARENAVHESRSRRAKPDNKSTVCITPARTLDAPAPVSSTKNQTAGMPSAAQSVRLFAQRSMIIPASKLTCIPDTATT